MRTLFTSYYSRALREPIFTKLNCFSISVSVPRYAPFAQLADLAPAYETVSAIKSGSINIAEYVSQYFELVFNQRRYTIEKLVDELDRLSVDKPVVLLCYEKVGDFCHRHILAGLINRSGLAAAYELTKPTDKPVDSWYDQTDCGTTFVLKSTYMQQPPTINL